MPRFAHTRTVPLSPSRCLSLFLSFIQKRCSFLPSHPRGLVLMSPLSGMSCGFRRSRMWSPHLHLLCVTSAGRRRLAQPGVGDLFTPTCFLSPRRSVPWGTQSRQKTRAGLLSSGEQGLNYGFLWHEQGVLLVSGDVDCKIIKLSLSLWVGL